VLAGGLDGRLRAFSASSGRELWARALEGEIFGAPVVIGPYVFVSTRASRTYALRVTDGKVVWRLRVGRYSPGIATERTYYFTLSGRLLAYRGRDVPEAREPSQSRGG
jgi:outer membrane protein assembly factor BamB